MKSLRRQHLVAANAAESVLEKMATIQRKCKEEQESFKTADIWLQKFLERRKGMKARDKTTEKEFKEAKQSRKEKDKTDIDREQLANLKIQNEQLQSERRSWGYDWSGGGEGEDWRGGRGRGNEKSGGGKAGGKGGGGKAGGKAGGKGGGG